MKLELFSFHSLSFVDEPGRINQLMITGFAASERTNEAEAIRGVERGEKSSRELENVRGLARARSLARASALFDILARNRDNMARRS